MAHFARVVVPDFPHHVTHRGNRRAGVFFSVQDRDPYRACLAGYAAKFHLKVWAYCVMTNHVHLQVVLRRTNSMAKGGRAQRADAGAAAREHMHRPSVRFGRICGPVWKGSRSAVCASEGRAQTKAAAEEPFSPSLPGLLGEK
jgi:REP element-mobilizing transposase RayT